MREPEVGARGRPPSSRRSQVKTRGIVCLALVGLTMVSCKSSSTTPEDGREPELSAVVYQLPACSPDGEYIAFYRRAEHFGEPGGLALVRRDGTDERFLLPGGDTPSWHPSGGILAIALGGRITTYEVQSARVGECKQIGDENYFPAWSPTGDSLVYWCNGPIDLSGLWIVDMSGQGSIRRLTPASIVAKMPAWGPRGDLVAFSGHLVGESGNDVWTIDVDGTGLRRITTGKAAYRPQWSPDGRELLYRDGGPVNHIEVVDIESGSTHRLTGAEASNLSEGMAACWTPDGSTVIYNKVCLWSWTNGVNRPLTCDR